MRVGDVLQQHGFTGARRRHDQRPLAFTDRRNQIDDPGRAVFDRRIFDFHRQTFIGIKRRQVIKGDLVPGLLGLFKVDLSHVGQGKITLVVVSGALISPSIVSPVRSEYWRIISGET